MIIKAEDISKQYRLGLVGTGTLTHDLNRWWYRMTGREDPYIKIGETNDRTQKGVSDYIWALKDINFQVEQGELLGIIGRNGAGKSTLLKILSRTTTPTTGNVKIKGRVASLLEVGTGFHPELTGRQNIFLNGAILGMTKNEIKRKFDEIVDFSGVERYIDTPVKRYSSGMYVRLAFAVAAHLESEILIVDEVLAVGDMEFQKKCLGKMQSVSKTGGRTILFVSHNMAAIENICRQVMVMGNGSIICPKTDTKAAIEFYNQTVIGELVNLEMSNRLDRQGTGQLKFTGLKFFDKQRVNIQQPICGKPLIIQLFYHTEALLKTVSVAIGFNSWNGENKFVLWTELINKNYTNIQGDGYFECEIEKFPLSQGSYLINVFAKTDGEEILDWIQEAASVEIENGDFYGTGKSISHNYNSVLIQYKWN